jgi:tRNA(fMet)-specific endonuclease VapC
MVVLDTDHITLLEQARGDAFRRLSERLSGLTSSDRVTTIISYEEQTRGWLAYVSRARTVSQQIDAYGKLNHHLDTYREIDVLVFSETAATEFQRLRNIGIRIGTMDLRIAAIVLATGAKLLSRNLVDFRLIPNFDVEDWTT